jgi:hypothetical protein
MTTAPIKLTEGCYGRDRTGRVHGPISKKEGHEVPFFCEGKDWFENGRWSLISEVDFDIIEIVPAPPTENSDAMDTYQGTKNPDKLYSKTEKLLFSLMTMCDSEIDDATFRKIAKESFKIISRSYTWA